VQEEKERKRLQKLVTEGKPIPAPAPIENANPPRQRIAHFVMNLPDSAIQFLDAFRGLLIDAEGRDLSGIYEEMPMVHCHCFTRELELDKAEQDIRQVSQFILVASPVRLLIPYLTACRRNDWSTSNRGNESASCAFCRAK
jgi:tRNA G37 N-methylase Trm5